MKLLNLHAHNVFSIGTIDLDLEDRGLTLVTGWSYDDKNGNMAGKSSLARNAISWGMYGKTIDGVRADDVINTSIPNAKHCGVRIHFEGIDGKQYRIYRSRKPNSLVLSSLYQNDRGQGDEWDDLSKRNEKDTQALIDKLLGRDHKTFIQSDFFGQGRERSFLALPGSEQRAVIEEILPLNSLDAWADTAAKERKEAQNRVDNAAQNLRMQAERVTMARNHLQGLEAQESSWSTDNITQTSQAQHKLNEVQLCSAGVEAEIKALQDSLPAGDTETILSTYYNLEKTFHKSICQLGYNIDSLTSIIDKRSAKPEICSECDQPYPTEKITLNATAIANDKIKRDDLIKQRGEAEAKLYNTQAQIGICKEVKELKERLRTKEGEAALVSKLDLLTTATNPFSKLVSSSRSELEIERRAYDNYRKIHDLEEKQRDHYLFWDRAFGKDLKTLLFNQVCPFLEAKANKYLADLNNGQIKVSFSTTKTLKSGDEKDEFCVTAKSDTGSTSFKLFSGAERQLTSFAVGMALSDLAALRI
jgi:DNA repair exonuclease SbcCD ATPase subunit